MENGKVKNFLKINFHKIINIAVKDWNFSSHFLKNISPAYIKFKNSNITISTNIIANLGSGFEVIKLTDEDIKNAKPYIYEKNLSRSKNNYFGTLYYSYFLFNDNDGDLRISYYKLKTPDKISVIGMKNGNEIVPHTTLDGFKDVKVFKSYGDDYKIDDFLTLLRGEGHGVYITFKIISIIMIVISVILIGFGIKNKD